MQENLLNVDQLAENLNVPKSWVYSRTRESGPESIPKIRLGKYIRFEINAVMRWLREQDKGD